MIDISSPAALAVANRQKSGFRGVALLHDAALGHLVLLRVEDTGCNIVATGNVAMTEAPHELVELPSLNLPIDATPEQAMRLAEAAIRRLAAGHLN